MKKLIYFFILSFLFIYNTYPQWVEVNSPLNDELLSISVVNDSTLWVCAKNIYIFKSANGGINYSNAGSFPNNQINCVYAFDINKAYISIFDQTLHASRITYTTDGGANWLYQNDYSSSIFTSIQMSSSINGLAVGYDYFNTSTRWSLFKTTNGSSWDSTGLYVPKAPYETCTPNNMVILGTYIWFTSSYHKIYFSSNNGQSWQIQTPYYNNYSFSPFVWFNNQNNGLATEGSTTSYSTNSGFNWVATPQQFSVDHSCGITGINNIFWFGFSTTIYMTSNYGTNWVLDYTSPFGDLRFLAKARNGNTAWVTRSNGGIAKRNNLIGIKPISTIIPSSYALYQNYPNPFNPSTHIRYDVSRSGYIKLAVYDILGREVAVLVNEQLKPGEYEAVWTADNIPSGVYFYKLVVSGAEPQTAGGFSETKKMMLVK